MPSPSRTYPTKVNPGDTIAGDVYAATVAANSERLYEMAITHLVNVAGSVNAITADANPPLIANPVHGQTFRLVPAGNNTGAVTLAPSGRGPFPVRDYAGVALAANTLVAGVAVDLWYDANNGYFRLSQLALNQAINQLAAASAAASLWQTINDTTVSSAQPQIEHLFTAGAYQKLVVTLTDICGSSASATNVTMTLRNGAGAVLTIDTGIAANLSGASSSAAVHFEALLSRTNANKTYVAMIYSVFNQAGTISTGAGGPAGAFSATAVDRVRAALSVGNIVQGRMVSIGLKWPA